MLLFTGVLLVVLSERDFEEYCLVLVGGKKLQDFLPCAYFVSFLLFEEHYLSQKCLLGNIHLKTGIRRPPCRAGGFSWLLSINSYHAPSPRPLHPTRAVAHTTAHR